MTSTSTRPPTPARAVREMPGIAVREMPGIPPGELAVMLASAAAVPGADAAAVAEDLRALAGPGAAGIVSECRDQYKKTHDGSHYMFMAAP